MITALYLVWALVGLFLILAWPRISTGRGWELVALGGSLALSVAHQAMFSTVAEDAFISLRYSMNLAEGNGFVFNAGEKVEGYSNFLWVVLVAAPGFVADVDYILVARVLGVLCTLVAVVLAYLLVKRITGKGAFGVLAATLTAAATSLAAYGPSGLESPLFVLLLFAVLLAVHSDKFLVAGLWVALATLTRPDGAIVAAVVGVWVLVVTMRARSGVRPVLWYLVGALVIAVPWTAWRLAYYGHLLPNAVAAKSGADLGWQLEVGWDYFLSFAGATQAALVLVPLAVYRLTTRTDGESGARRAIWLMLLLALVYLTFFIGTGGDWMPAWRFFAPVVPLLTAATVAAWGLTGSEATRPVGRAAAIGTVTISLFALMVSTNHPSTKPAIEAWRLQVHDLSDIGTWLRNTLPDGTVISTYANGALSYEAGSDVTVVDLLGLTDEHIAREGKRLPKGVIGHTAYDYEYVIEEREPAVVFFQGGGYLPAIDCSSRPPFDDEYTAVPFQVRGEQKYAMTYLRKETLEKYADLLDRHPDFTRMTCPG